MPGDSLRRQQMDLGRRAIFDVIVRHLEAGDADDLSMDELAREAGLSRKTLYRHFPDRDGLFAAAGEWIRDRVLQLPIEIEEGGIAASFQAAASRLQRRPALARAMLRSRMGRALRTGYREARLDAIRRALRREAPGLSRREMDRAAPVLAYLCSSNAWITIQDESGLAPAAARAAVVWAIEALVAGLRQTPARTTRRTRQ